MDIVMDKTISSTNGVEAPCSKRVLTRLKGIPKSVGDTNITIEWKRVLKVREILTQQSSK